MKETEEGPRYSYVLGVDPGTTTGLAIAMLDGRDGGRPAAAWGEQLPWQEACRQVELKLEKLRRLEDEGRLERAAAVCELYAINAQTAQRGQEGANDAIGMIGVVRRNCQLTGVEFAGLQQASAAKTLVKDHVLKGLHIYAPGLGHVNDAYRHAILLAVKRHWTAGRWLTEGLRK